MITGSEIREARERKGMTQAALAKAVNVSQAAINSIEAGRTSRSKFLPDIARVLGLSKDNQLQPRVRLAPVKGTVAAGAWLDHIETEADYPDLVPHVPARFGNLEQFAFRISGNSVDLARLHDGDYAICVDYWLVRNAPTDGDIVIVERRRGAEIERTCKILKCSLEGYELWPRSTNPKWQTPIVVKKDHLADDGTTIELVALVIGRYSPL